MINRILWAISKVDDINKTQEYVKQLAKNFNAKVFLINIVPDYQNFTYSVKEEEKIKIESEKTKSAEKINVDFLKNIKENELNWIKL